MRNSMEKKLHIMIPTVLGIILAISLIPILYMSRFEFATGDDLGYGRYTHDAWLAGHSLLTVWKAVISTVRSYYYSWQGTWFTIALMSLQPEVFDPGAYWITPWIMVTIVILATTLGVRTVAKTYTDMPAWAWLSIDILILLAMIQYFPSTASGIFWYNGCAHYVIPYGIGMAAMWAMIRYRETCRSSYLIWACITMTALGGSSYLMPVFAIVVCVYLIFADIVEKNNKPAWWLCLPMVLECIGLVISFLAPGNKCRGGDDFGFSAGNAVLTILASLKSAFTGMGTYAKECPYIYVCLVLITLIAYVTFAVDERKHTFRLPGLFILAMYCLYAAVYAPGIYAGVELSGGVPNTIFQVFLLTSSCSLVYLSGWLAGHLKISRKGIKAAAIVLLAGCAVFIVVERSSVKESTSYECLKYVASGQAEDFRAQMEYNRAILLDDTVKDCYLCPVNSDQGPLMHMPVTDDPEKFTNSVTRNFYGKELVVTDGNLNINAENTR